MMGLGKGSSESPLPNLTYIKLELHYADSPVVLEFLLLFLESCQPLLSSQSFLATVGLYQANISIPDDLLPLSASLKDRVSKLQSNGLVVDILSEIVAGFPWMFLYYYYTLRI